MIGKTLDLEDRRIANPTLSPDGRWLAYVSGETGRREIFLRSYPDLQKKIPAGPGRALSGTGRSTGTGRANSNTIDARGSKGLDTAPWRTRDAESE